MRTGQAILVRTCAHPIPVDRQHHPRQAVHLVDQEAKLFGVRMSRAMSGVRLGEADLEAVEVVSISICRSTCGVEGEVRSRIEQKHRSVVEHHETILQADVMDHGPIRLPQPQITGSEVGAEDAEQVRLDLDPDQLRRHVSSVEALASGEARPPVRGTP